MIEHKRARLNGVDYAYRSGGDGPPLLMLGRSTPARSFASRASCYGAPAIRCYRRFTCRVSVT